MGKEVESDQPLIYEGETNEHGEFHGHGKLIDNGKVVYDGEWINGVPQSDYWGSSGMKGSIVNKNEIPPHFFRRLYVRVPDDGDEYVGDVKDGKAHGKGHCTFADGEQYTGDWVSGQRHGRGRAISSDGRVQLGFWSQGDIIGRGMRILSNGTIFQVECSGNGVSGCGRINYPDGDVYKGALNSDGQPNGFGMMDFAKKANWNWSRFIGLFENGMPSKPGLVYMLNGSYLVCPSKESESEDAFEVPDGFIEMYYLDGTRVCGRFENGWEEHNGKYYSTWQNIYEGECVDGLPHGYGKMTERDGAIIEGNFEKGNPCGLCKETALDGEIIEGTYDADGYPCGRVKVTGADGSIYEGELSRDKLMHGHGKMIFADGSVFEGEWKNGKMRNGILVNADASLMYKGHFKRNRPHGRGMEISCEGHTWTGEWRNGERVETPSQPSHPVHLGSEENEDDVVSYFWCILIFFGALMWIVLKVID